MYIYGHVHRESRLTQQRSRGPSRVADSDCSYKLPRGVLHPSGVVTFIESYGSRAHASAPYPGIYPSPLPHTHNTHERILRNPYVSISLDHGTDHEGPEQLPRVDQNEAQATR